MVTTLRGYLIELKKVGNYSWSYLSRETGYPEGTIRKIFSGETVDPRFETVAKLVIVMNGDLNVAAGLKPKVEHNFCHETKQAFQERIAELKETISLLRKDKKHLAISLFVLGCFIVLWFILDISIGTRGWFKF